MAERPLLRPFLQPRSIAILARGRVGAPVFLEKLAESGFPGRVTVIDPEPSKIVPFGVQRVSLMAELQGAPDLLILDCAPEDRLRLLLMAERKGIAAVLDVSRVAGADSDADTQEGFAILFGRRTLRLVGPDSAGLADISLGNPFALSTRFEMPPGGSVALIGQDAFTARLVASHGAAGLNLGTILDLGEAQDIGPDEALADLARHGEVSVVLLALSKLARPEAFRQVARNIAPMLPLAAHFPAPDNAPERDGAIAAFLTDCGVLRVGDAGALALAGRVLERFPTGIGGPIHLLCDDAARNQAEAALQGAGLHIASGMVEAAGVLALLPPGPHGPDGAESLTPGLVDAAALGRPVIAAGLGEGPAQTRSLRRAGEGGALTFARMEDAVRAFVILAERHRLRLSAFNGMDDDAPTAL